MSVLHLWKILPRIIADLGVSSPQLDRPSRGFSYKNSKELILQMYHPLPAKRELAEVLVHAPSVKFAQELPSACEVLSPGVVFRWFKEGYFQLRCMAVLVARSFFGAEAKDCSAAC